MAGDVRYVKPESLTACCELLATEEPALTALLAGGTDLVLRLKGGQIAPALIVDLGAIDELRGVTIEGDRVRVGATTSAAELAAHHELKRLAPCLVSGAACLGSAQIRTMATVGGNIVNASPVADTVPPLFVLGAELVIVNPSGERRVAIEEFATGPGSTVLKPDEVLVAVEFTGLASDEHAFYLRTAQRRKLSIAKASVACRLKVVDGKATEVRIAAGAVAPTVILAPGAAAALEGQEFTLARVQAAGETLTSECTPIDDHRSTKDYRASVTGRLLEKGLRSLIGGTAKSA